MALRLAAAAALVAPATALVGSQQGHGFLSASMRPDAVAHVLLEVEDEWKAQADLFSQCSQQSEDMTAVDCNSAPKAFEKSCGTVVKSVISGSSGEADAINEYLGTVCSQHVMSEWHQAQCNKLAKSVKKALSGNAYENRENLNVPSLCTGLWSELLKDEQAKIVQEAKDEASEPKEEKKEETAAPKTEWPKSIDDIQADKDYHSNFTRDDSPAPQEANATNNTSKAFF